MPSSSEQLGLCSSKTSEIDPSYKLQLQLTFKLYTPSGLLLGKKSTLPFEKRLGGPQRWSDGDGKKNNPSNIGRPSHVQSLYWMSFPASLSEFSFSFWPSWTLFHLRSLVRPNLWIRTADSSVSSLLFLARTGFTEHPLQCCSVQPSTNWRPLAIWNISAKIFFFTQSRNPICPGGEFSRNLTWACTAQYNDVRLST
jgi:hypothetical protein